MNRFGCGFEVKFADDAEDGTFAGYGAVFGNIDSYGDMIVKGAFKDTLREAKKSGQWPAMLLQHGGWGSDDMTPIGVWTDFEEDDKGLKVEGKLAVETQRGKDVHALLKMKPRPAITGMSIGYRVRDFERGTKPGMPIRTIKKVHLVEVSLVTFPANTLARIDGVKGLVNLTERQMEDWLVRDAGLSRSQAKAFIADGFKALKGMRDAAPGEDGLVEAIRKVTEAIRA